MFIEAFQLTKNVLYSLGQIISCLQLFYVGLNMYIAHQEKFITEQYNQINIKIIDMLIDVHKNINVWPNAKQCT